MRTAALLAALVVTGSASAVVYDVQADWSDTSNPNGVWSYHSASGLMTSGTWTGDAFGTPQQAWLGPFPRTWFQYNGTGPAFDWQPGDIITHSGGTMATILRFTSPVTGTLDVTGVTWQIRAIGRTVDWGFFLNNSLLTFGTMLSGATTRANPMNFFAGSGGAAALTNIAVTAGDQLELHYTGTPEYAGVSRQVNAVPEPATLAGLGLGGLALLRRRRRG